MNLPSSFRARFLIGSLLWTAGFLMIAHIISVFMFIGHDAFGSLPHVPIALCVAAIAMVIGLTIARSGLSSLNELRKKLTEVHEGQQRQLEGKFLAEVQPLVDDLNNLLAHHDARVKEALAKAGDLAHGLKTPLAVLAHEADCAAAAGQPEIAAAIHQQVNRMHRQVEYHLAHARASASGAMPAARCSVAESVEALVRTLARLHADRGLTMSVSVPSDHVVRTQREDLDEMLGNLLDNACKWGRCRINVTSQRTGDEIAIAIDDDGSGLEPALRTSVLQRGVRADEASPGSGLGLAIVRDLVAVYGGSISLDASPLGGLRACLRLPAARSASIQVQ